MLTNFNHFFMMHLDMMITIIIIMTGYCILWMQYTARPQYSAQES